jgi:hypothetical protein
MADCEAGGRQALGVVLPRRRDETPGAQVCRDCVRRRAACARGGGRLLPASQPRAPGPRAAHTRCPHAREGAPPAWTRRAPCAFGRTAERCAPRCADGSLRAAGQLFKATAPVIALGLLAVAAVLLVTSEQEFAVSVRAQAGSWTADHKPMRLDGISAAFSTKKRALKIAKGTKLDWGGSEEFMADDAAKIASNQANIFEPKYGQTPPPVNKGYLDEIEQAQGEQTQETIDNAALAAVSDVGRGPCTQLRLASAVPQ